MSTLRHATRQLRGFTLIEMVLVLALLAAIFGMAAPSVRGFGRGQQVENAADQLLADVARARSDAAITAMRHRLQVDLSGAGYEILRDDVEGEVSVGGPIVLPEGVTLEVRDAGGTVGGLALNMATEFVEFDVDGRMTPARFTLSGHGGREIVLEAIGVADSLRRVREGKIP